MSVQAPERLAIESFEDLVEHEREILQRINELPNGGHLFLIHPFMLLEDVGVVLSDEAKREILRRQPQLQSLSPTPYRILRRRSEPEPHLRVRVHGLFGR
jgi:hypothetical protein